VLHTCAQLPLLPLLPLLLLPLPLLLHRVAAMRAPCWQGVADDALSFQDA